jgi:hypothetical protein
MMPDHRPAKIKIVLKDRSILEAQTFTNKGDAEDSYDADELRAKYFNLMDPVWGNEISNAVYQETMALAQLNRITRITDYLKKAQ